MAANQSADLLIPVKAVDIKRAIGAWDELIENSWEELMGEPTNNSPKIENSIVENASDS